MFTRLFSLLTTDIFIPNYLNVLDRENDIIKCQILVEIIIIEDNIFHLLWRICVISFISIIYRFQTKWLPRRRSRTKSPLVCIYISLTGKYLKRRNQEIEQRKNEAIPVDQRPTAADASASDITTSTSTPPVQNNQVTEPEPPSRQPNMIWGNHTGEDLMMLEAREIQARMRSQQQTKTSNISKEFTKHMLKGNIKSALRLLESTSSKGVLKLNENIMNTLRNLHPERNDPSPEVMLDQEVEEIDPIIYESIDGQSILLAVLKTKGAAGPSNLDADGWRRILVSINYGNVGEDLRTSLANMLKIMCRQNIDPNTRDIEAFLSCRLIPLIKTLELDQ